MPYIPDVRQNTGSFVQQTPVFDVSRIYEVNVNSDEFKELIVTLAQQINNISIVLNNKESGYFLTEEFVTSALFYNPASSNQLELIPEFRLTINIGSLGAGVTTVAHGLPITASWKFVDIYGTANDSIGFNYYPLPFSSAVGATNIELRVNGTNVIITNNSGINFTSCNVVLEYIKS